MKKEGKENKKGKHFLKALPLLILSKASSSILLDSLTKKRFKESYTRPNES